MAESPNAQVLTRRGPTVHEDIGEQLNRLSGELWKEYAEKLRASEEVTYGRALDFVVTHPDENCLSTRQTFRNAWVRNTFPSTWPSVVVVLAVEPIELGPEFRSFHQYLHAPRGVFFTRQRGPQVKRQRLSAFFTLHTVGRHRASRNISFPTPRNGRIRRIKDDAHSLIKKLRERFR